MEAQKDAGLKDKYERTARPGTNPPRKRVTNEDERPKNFSRARERR